MTKDSYNPIRDGITKELLDAGIFICTICEQPIKDINNRWDKEGFKHNKCVKYDEG